jgi:hypothetical protein
MSERFMPERLLLTSSARAAALVLALLLALAGRARADELADFNAAVENAMSHNRVAIGYLRTGNIDFAGLEIDRLRDSWSVVASRFGKPPAAFASHAQLYTTTMLDVSTRLVGTAIMIGSGRPAIASDGLIAIRNEISDLRKAAGVTVLADCVRDANDAMDALYVFNDRALDWSKSDTSASVLAKASAYRDALDRCDGMADAATRDNPEFRRLIDGAKTSLGLIPETAQAHDTGRLHRILIELRSFDNLLAFRYG